MNLEQALRSFFPELSDKDITDFIEFVTPYVLGPIGRVTNDAEASFLGEAILGIPDWTNIPREERIKD